MATRTRLNPEERRKQLLALGAELFAETAYEDVHIEDVAEMAQVSRGLLYHYFPNKRQFFLELLDHATKQLARVTEPIDDAPPVEQLSRGIEAYFEHCAANSNAVRAIYRGAASGDPEVRRIITASVEVHADRILATLAPDGNAPDALRIAVTSWLEFLRSACYQWLNSPGTSRDDVRDICIAALLGSVQAAAGVHPRVATRLP